MADNEPVIGLDAELRISEFERSLSAYQAALDKATDATSSAADHITQAGDVADHATAGIDNLATAFYAGLGSALADWVIPKLEEAIQSLTHFTDAAAQEEQGVARLGAAVRATGADWDTASLAIESYITAQQERTSLDDGEAREALIQLVSITGDYETSLSLLSVAMDMSAAKGQSLSSSAMILGRVAQGNTSILSRYGIVLDEGATATEAIAAITEKFGGQSEAMADTVVGSSDRMSTAFGNVKESIGGIFLPAITAAQNKIADFVQAILPGFNAFSEIVGSAVEMAAGYLDDGFDTMLRTVGIKTGDMAATAEQGGIAIGYQLAEGIASAIPYVVGALQAIGDIISWWLEPASPPEVAADVDEWGAELVYIYAEAIADAAEDTEVRTAMSSVQAALADAFDVTAIQDSLETSAYNAAVSAQRALIMAMASTPEQIALVESELAGLEEGTADYYTKLRELLTLQEQYTNEQQAAADAAAALAEAEAAAATATEEEAAAAAGELADAQWEYRYALADTATKLEMQREKLAGTSDQSADYYTILLAIRSLEETRAGELEDAAAAQDTLTEAEWQYRYALADTTTKLQMQREKLADTTVNSVEYYDVMLAIHDLEQQLADELEEAADATTDAGRAASGGAGAARDLAKALDEAKKAAEEAAGGAAAAADTFRVSATEGLEQLSGLNFADRLSEIFDEVKIAEKAEEVRQSITDTLRPAFEAAGGNLASFLGNAFRAAIATAILGPETATEMVQVSPGEWIAEEVMVGNDATWAEIGQALRDRVEDTITDALLGLGIPPAVASFMGDHWEALLVGTLVSAHPVISQAIGTATGMTIAAGFAKMVGGFVRFVPFVATAATALASQLWLTIGIALETAFGEGMVALGLTMTGLTMATLLPVIFPEETVNVLTIADQWLSDHIREPIIKALTGGGGSGADPDFYISGKEFFSTWFRECITRPLEDLAEDTEDRWEGMTQWIEDGLASIKIDTSGLEAAWGDVTGFFTDIVPGLMADAIDTALDIEVDMRQWLADLLGIGDDVKVPGWDDIGVALWNGLTTGFGDSVETKWDEFEQWLTWLVDEVKAFFGIASPSTVFYAMGTDLVQGMIDGVVSIIGLVVDEFEQMGTDITTAWTTTKEDAEATATEWYTSASTWATNLQTTITTAWQTVQTDVTTAWADAKLDVETKATEWYTSVTTWGTNVQTDLSSKWATIKIDITTAWDDAKTDVETAAGTWRNTLLLFGQNVWSDAKTQWTLTEGSIIYHFGLARTSVEGKAQAIYDYVTGVWASMIQYFTDIKQTIIDTAVAPWQAAYDAIISIWNSLPGLPNVPTGDDSGGSNDATDGGGAAGGGGQSAHATGTPQTVAGLSLVGETGPELVQFPAGARVFSTQDSTDILAQFLGSLPAQMAGVLMNKAGQALAYTGTAGVSAASVQAAGTTVAVNIGPVTVANGMDEARFSAMVRRAVADAL